MTKITSVQDLMARWVQEQEQQLRRARIMAATMKSQMGEMKVDEDFLLYWSRKKWENKSGWRVARDMATPLTLMVYELMDQPGEEE